MMGDNCVICGTNSGFYCATCIQREERARIVAWLREHGVHLLPGPSGMVLTVADCLERGDHLKEGGK